MKDHLDTSRRQPAEKITPTQRMLNMWAIVLIMWAFYRAHFKTDLPIYLDEFIIKPLIFITPLYYYVQKYEHHSFWSAMSIKIKGWKGDILIGGAIGGIFLIGGVLANYTKYHTLLSPHPLYLKQYSLWMLLAVAVASSITEEILMRGFVLKRLYQETKSILKSVFFVSFLFFFLHIPILFTIKELNGYTILQIMATDLVFSMVVSLAYLQRKSLTVPILIHLLYTIALYVFL